MPCLPGHLVARIDQFVTKGTLASREAFMVDAARRHITAWQREERLVARRAALLATPTMTVRELAEKRGEDEAATLAWLAPLRAAGAVIVTPTNDGTSPIVPGFQITADGEVGAVVVEVNRALTRSRLYRLWPLWAWWHARTSWLSGASPIDLIDTAPDQLLAAARREAERKLGDG